MLKCDINAVVTILRPEKSRDPFVLACAQNIWYCSSTHDIDIDYVDIRGQ